MWIRNNSFIECSPVDLSFLTRIGIIPNNKRFVLSKEEGQKIINRVWQEFLFNTMSDNEAKHKYIALLDTNINYKGNTDDLPVIAFKRLRKIKNE